MSRPLSASLQRAIAYLFEIVRSRSPRSVLPSVAILARQCQVAYVTMWKALDHARRQGLVDARPRRGIVVIRRPLGATADGVAPAEQRAVAEAGALRGRKYERTAAALRRDLLAGGYTPGTPLPSRKELSERYGVCPATLAKALRQLVSEQTLTQQRTHFLPSRAPSARRQNTVLLIAGGDRNGTVSMAHARTPGYLRDLEHACSLRNVSLSLATCDTARCMLHDPGLLHRLRTDQALRSSLLGVIVWQAGMEGPGWAGLARQFAPLRRPIALLDESGEYPVPQIAGTGRRIRLYALGFSAEAGLRMGRHLLALGHRRMAYISPVHRTAWSRNRLDGVREACARSGLPRDAVQEYVLNDYGLPAEFLQASASARDRLLHALDLTEPSLRADPLSASTLCTLRAGVDRALAKQAYALAMRPLMEAALADPDITAWVAADDDTALPCLDFLRASGRRVPQEISVAGFDDSFESSVHKLTSYNYNGPAYMRAMLAHVLSPGCPESGGRRAGPVEIEGSVIQRQTTAPAPGQR